MQCLKCGKETADDRTFCQSCMENMEKYPVKPGTPVQLPIRANASAVRKAPIKKRPSLSEKEQIAKLGRKVRLLVTALILLLAALTAVAGLLIHQYFKTPVRPTGQNYSTISVEPAPQA